LSDAQFSGCVYLAEVRICARNDDSLVCRNRLLLLILTTVYASGYGRITCQAFLSQSVAKYFPGHDVGFGRSGLYCLRYGGRSFPFCGERDGMCVCYRMRCVVCRLFP